MAYYNQDQQDEEQQQQQDQSGQPVQLSNQSANVAAPAAPVPQQPKAPKSSSSGMGAGFQNFAKANQGAAQNRLNQSVSQNVANQGQIAKTSVNQAQTAFGQRVDAGSLKNREKALQDISGIVGSARQLTAAPKPVVPVAPATNTGVVPPAPAPQAPANPLSGIAQADQDRFKEVINSRYQGPESLRQAGLYEKAAAKVGTAQTALDQSKSAGGREELLKNMYQKRADYTGGLSKLDSALLNANQAGVQQLQQTAQAQGNLGQQLDQAQIGSYNQAQNRAGEIRNIQEQARNEFTTGKQAEEAATEARLSSVIKDWDKLPEHFRNAIRNKEKDNQATINERINNVKSTPEYLAAQTNLQKAQALPDKVTVVTRRGRRAIPNQRKAAAVAAANSQMKGIENNVRNSINQNAVNLSAEEATVLGVGAGEGLYKLGADAIKTAQADKTKLISRDEQSRQAALAALAGLDQSNRLDTNLQYADADIAGTQTAVDALDLEATRAGLKAAEENFGQSAKGTNLTGIGVKKVSRGNAFGKKTKTYRASVGGNVGKMLEQGGYNLDTPENAEINSSNLLKDYLKATNTDRNNADAEDNQKVLESTGKGAAAGAAIGSMVPGVGTGVGAVIGAGLGTTVGAGTVDSLQQYTDLMQGFGGPGAAIGKGIQDVRSAIAKPINGIGGDIGKGIGGMVGGINSGAMKAYGSAIAKDHAIKDLQNKYRNYLNSQGFDNRFGIANNEQTQTRMSALQQILDNMDKTNLKNS